MKRTILPAVMTVIAFVALHWAPAVAATSRIVESPVINFANTTSIDIVKVEFTDSSTVLNVTAHYYPGMWIRIASDTRLEANGHRYAMTGTDGITPDTEFWMPESGTADFKLIFEPLPADTKKFDFIEGDSEGAFHLWDIDISGEPRPEFPDGLPAELRKEPIDGSVPQPAFEIGRTTLNVHMLPYRKEFGDRMTLYINQMGSAQESFPIKIDKNGNGTVSFDQYGSAVAFLSNDMTNLAATSMVLYPGETVDCYLDMRTTGFAAMLQRPKTDKALKNSFLRHRDNGRYGSLNSMLNTRKKYYGMQLYNGTFADYRMTGPEYMQMVKDRYRASADSIARSDMSRMAKEYSLLQLRNNVLEAIGDYRFFLEHNYRHVTDNYDRRSPVPADSIRATLTDADFAEVTTWFDASDPRLLIPDNSREGLTVIDWNSHGVTGDLSRSLRLYGKMAVEARRQHLQESDLDSLRTLSNPFFAAACDTLNRRTARELARLSKLAEITPTPDVPDDQVFDAIIAPHKGKVVVVDIWNTWCGPCRQAIRLNEDLKNGELSSDDIVWIYIADESSDMVPYLGIISGVRGIHYKVTSDQYNAIGKRFSMDGIPYYILVDRNGNAQGRPDLRSPRSYIEAIRSALLQ